MPGFFISYRRDDSAGHAGRLHDRLVENFGRENIFIDVETIGLGMDFLEAIRDAIRATDGLIAVVGREWLGSTDETGNRRLDNPQDFVRLEIATAFELGVRVIPVLVQGAPQLRAADLPDDLQQLASLNSLEVSDTRFHADVDRLIEALGAITLDEAAQLAISTAQSTPGEYGAEFDGLTMSFEVVETSEIEDQYAVTLSFQPEGRAGVTPGREQFFIAKGGHVDRRQVITRPVRVEGRRFTPILAVVGVLIVIGVVAAVLAITGGGDDNPPTAATNTSRTPDPPTSQSSTATVVVPTAGSSPIGVTLTVELETPQITVVAGATLDLVAIVSDGSGRRIDGPAIQWTVIPEAGSINAEGVLAAGTKAGSFLGAVQLTAEQGASTGQATFDVTIEPGPLDKLEVLPGEVVISRGESVQLAVAGSDNYANPITDLESVWESEGGLNVDENGLVTAGQREAASPLPGLVGWWAGDGDAEDRIGNRDGVSSVGVSYSPGVFGQGFRFDGVDDSVEIEDSGQLNIRGDVTAHLWAKRAILGGPAVMIIKGAGVKANVDVPTVFILKFGSRVSPVGDGDYLWGGFERSDGSDAFLVGPEVSDKSFHHYAYIRADNIHKLYLDGKEVASRSFVGSPGSTLGLTLNFGAGPSGGLTSQPFGGIIDEVQVFDRALTDAEVKEIFEEANLNGQYQITVSAKYQGGEQTTTVEVTVRD